MCVHYNVWGMNVDRAEKGLCAPVRGDESLWAYCCDIWQTMYESTRSGIASAYLKNHCFQWKLKPSDLQD
ncbi:hypothetical protein Pst134EA_011494 [Puccinia striiformis f. sp. tritici]|nr:hypothetical protein Pst134EA_011494 [Puccinia striiformis f. sp. tritici]KAH9467876.1 hypothetical protein Pst134EA_011494 [Puccinia striiformis f. sp. tritici]